MICVRYLHRIKSRRKSHRSMNNACVQGKDIQMRPYFSSRSRMNYLKYQPRRSTLTEQHDTNGSSCRQI